MTDPRRPPWQSADRLPRGDDASAVPLVVATRNRGKLAEFRRLLAGWPWRLLDLDEAGVTGEVDEPGPGYLENAVAKAGAAAAATGLCALADDSGLEVLGLGGWPGPHSARWMEGDDGDRLRGLLAELGRRSPGDRRARYVAVVALALPGAPAVAGTGVCDGTLVQPRGRRGFGYDPAFLSTDLGITFGEAADGAKDGVSHRARALRHLEDEGHLRRALVALRSPRPSG